MCGALCYFFKILSGITSVLFELGFITESFCPRSDTVLARGKKELLYPIGSSTVITRYIFYSMESSVVSQEDTDMLYVTLSLSCIGTDLRFHSMKLPDESRTAQESNNQNRN